MRKVLLPLTMALFILSCLKTNSTTPITSVQAAIDGHWQVDSLVNTIQDTVVLDSVFSNHFIDISSSGTTVTVSMSGIDPMNYTISDSSLGLYSSSALIPAGGFSSGGCGIPYTRTIVQVKNNDLIFYTSDSWNSVSAMYMHKGTAN